MILRAFSGLNNRKNSQKLLKINGKNEEKPKIFSYCDLMTDWGLAVGGCLKQMTFNYGSFAIIKGHSQCNMFLRTRFLYFILFVDENLLSKSLIIIFNQCDVDARRNVA